LRDGQKRSQAVDEAHARYVAEASPENLSALRDAISTYAYAPALVLSNSKDFHVVAELAAKHCIAQVKQFRPREHNGRTVRFSTWAAKVIRNKVRDANRKLFRDVRRKQREEARLDKQATIEQLRKQKEAKKKYSVAFKDVEVNAVIKKLQQRQARLLKLKCRTPRLPDAKIAADLGVTLSQLRNRWSRLRGKVKRMLESMAKLELLLNAGPQQKWYPGSPNTSYADFRRPGYDIPRSARRGPRGVFNF
jgi:RNA polymerase sigma factor (sigma-70 family)